MLLVDVNVCVAATNADDERHDAAREWLETALRGPETVGFAWLVILGFIRITTNPAAITTPFTPDRACAAVETWLRSRYAEVVSPQPGHLLRVAELLAEAGRGGNVVNDADLAALAMERGASVVSFDRDFRRFGGLRIETPGR